MGGLFLYVKEHKTAAKLLLTCELYENAGAHTRRSWREYLVMFLLSISAF